MDGVRGLAGERPPDAAAVALLLCCAIRVGELVSLTVGSVQTTAGHCVLRVIRKGGKANTVPGPAAGVRPGRAPPGPPPGE
ncbi:hypothetical protein GCM10023317_92980 [Actinopolymorpha pittospori]